MNPRRRNTRRFVKPAAPAGRRLQCVCGQGIDVLPDQHGHRQRCPGCRRTFDILVSKDAATGGDILSLAYLDKTSKDADPSAETSTSLDLLAPPQPKPKEGALTQADLMVQEPEPPDEAHFRCACGSILAIGKASYDKRVRCPVCGGRYLVTLAYEVEASSFTLHTFSLGDRASGSTRLAERIS
jgi:DNA-directed RNA polymerase subunit RPC12/RpoP